MATLATKRQKEETKPRIQSLLFKMLEVDGRNYLEWSNDIEAYLASRELDGTLKEATTTNALATSK